MYFYNFACTPSLSLFKIHFSPTTSLLYFYKLCLHFFLNKQYTVTTVTTVTTIRFQRIQYTYHQKYYTIQLLRY